MKKYLPIVLIIVGVAIFLGASFMPWTGKYLKWGDKFIDWSGYEIIFGQIAMGVAVFSVPLAYFRRRWVALSGLVVVLLSAVYYFKGPVEQIPDCGPLLGLHIAVAAAGLIFVGGIMAKPKR